jgi:lysophospholipase L1-like esterase
VTGTYLRYVALGDSQTEGMNDGDEVRGYRGWADRLAEQLTAVQPQLQYANLAVRGRVTSEVRTEQLPTALSLRPDLVTVLAGLNDLLRPRFDATAVAGHLESMFEALTGAGLLVPAARGLTRRAQDFNARVREAAHRHGVTLVDLSVYPMCTDPRLWSADRLHLNTLGHTRLAAAVAHALDLPDSYDLRTNSLDPQRKPSPWRRAGVELRWAVSFAGPWLLRRALGKSSGDGRTAKRPTLAPARQWPEPG